MQKFKTFVTEERASRETGAYKQALWPHKTRLDQAIAQHKDKAKSGEYQARKFRDKADDVDSTAKRAADRGNEKAKTGGDNAVSSYWREKASKAEHLAHRHQQAVEAGERVKSGTEYHLSRDRVNKAKAGFEEAMLGGSDKKEDTPKKKSWWRR